MKFLRWWVQWAFFDEFGHKMKGGMFGIHCNHQHVESKHPIPKTLHGKLNTKGGTLDQIKVIVP
jgi:hypothetical protein